MASLIAQSLRALPSALLRRAPAALSSTRTLACSAALRKENVPVTVAFGDGIGPEVRHSREKRKTERVNKGRERERERRRKEAWFFSRRFRRCSLSRACKGRI